MKTPRINTESVQNGVFPIIGLIMMATLVAIQTKSCSPPPPTCEQIEDTRDLQLISYRVGIRVKCTVDECTNNEGEGRIIIARCGTTDDTSQ